MKLSSTKVRRTTVVRNDEFQVFVLIINKLIVLVAALIKAYAN